MAVAEPATGMWYTVPEAAQFCHRSEAWVRTLVHKKKIYHRLVKDRPNRPKRIYLPAISVRELQALTLRLPIDA